MNRKQIVRILCAALFFLFVFALFGDYLGGHGIDPLKVLGAAVGAFGFVYSGRLVTAAEKAPAPTSVQPPAEEKQPQPKRWARPGSETGDQRVKKSTSRLGWDRVKLPSISIRKVRVPGLRTFKRWLAFSLVVLNFIIAELSLTGPGSQPFALFFLANCFLLIDYLWKTRKKAGTFE